MKTHYTYSHNKPNGTPFYIGKGSGNRAFTKRLNPYWKNIVAKYGYEVQILAHWKTHEEALDHEMLIIACMKDMGIELANMTEGGEGCIGFSHPHTEEHKQKLKGNSYGASSWGLTFKGKKHSEESKAKMSYARIGNKNKAGFKLSEESKEKIRQSKIGKILISRRLFTNNQILEIRNLLKNCSIAEIARKFKVGESTIRRVRDGVTYGDVQ